MGRNWGQQLIYRRLRMDNSFIGMIGIIIMFGIAMILISKFKTRADRSNQFIAFSQDIDKFNQIAIWLFDEELYCLLGRDIGMIGAKGEEVTSYYYSMEDIPRTCNISGRIHLILREQIKQQGEDGKIIVGIYLFGYSSNGIRIGFLYKEDIC
jgi:hypothetical protein